MILGADGIVVSNYHVVGQATDISVVLNDGREYQARVLLGDEASDLAILQLEEAKDNKDDDDQESDSDMRLSKKGGKKAKGKAKKASNAAPKPSKPVQAKPVPTAAAKGKKGGRRRKKGDDVSEDEDETVDTSNTCAVCKGVFPSKNKLFSHLKSTGHSIYVGK